jgi:hypothetical protein
MYNHYWIGLVLAVVLLMAPSLSFILWGWKERLFEILSGLESKEQSAIRLYFGLFHPRFESISDQGRRFEKYYNKQFGRKFFIFPMILFFLVALFLLLESCQWMQSNRSSLLNPPSKAVPVFAVLGAYMWTLYDQISRWWYSDLSPGDLYWASFRFATSIPLGYAVSQFAAESMAPALAFFLGAFPISALFSIMRKLGRQKLNLGEGADNFASQLQELHGIDANMAERFAAERITTISQLAYYDPVKLTIRTNLPYSYIVDCASQALLWIYTEKDLDTWRKAGLRSTFEIINLSNTLNESSQADLKNSESILKLLASQLNINEVAVRNIIEEIARDPYSEFLYKTWVPL